MNLLQIETVSLSKIERILETLLEQGTHLGLAILKALIIFIIGRFVINLINKLVKKLLNKKDVAPAVRTFVASLVNIILIVMLIISIIGALGIQTTSFAALIASAGVAIGMALSGNLSNFAGGLIILLFKPFKIGDYIGTSSVSGTVQEIQIFHTILTTSDNITVYIPNGTLSSGYINNYNVDKRRIEWIFGVDYGEDFDKVRKTILEVLAADTRIMSDPAPFVELNQLDASSVNIIVRVWAKGSDYWDVYFNINKNVYQKFNEVGIDFPFPQLTIHKVDKDSE
ncbi:mechanosensitive ion channel family protein [Dysgonomonas sp. 25]|uniref:mechanosensitive ion channel family protein n=1 Tax=Dysgonomonas sp. 25 TaxID=2302933 RepID=UPI0013CFD1A6|nr:mechanosensitive ion channel domain-containing protein [Dysgonomonas sp. 25]NDV70240.1 mechanosensitive ion channel family protein [Dysgonomonas sp. 25]